MNNGTFTILYYQLFIPIEYQLINLYYTIAKSTKKKNNYRGSVELLHFRSISNWPVMSKLLPFQSRPTGDRHKSVLFTSYDIEVFTSFVRGVIRERTALAPDRETFRNAWTREKRFHCTDITREEDKRSVVKGEKGIIRCFGGNRPDVLSHRCRLVLSIRFAVAFWKL